MSIKVITEFLNETTVRIVAYVRDEDDALVDPTSCLIDLYDPDGTAEEEKTAMSKSDTGIYEFFFYTDTDTVTGNWRGVCWSVDGSGATAKYSEASFGFRMKE